MSVVPHNYGPQGIPPAPTILIVDDNQPTARALAALLGGAGYRTAVAFRGADALDRASRQGIAAAIVDIHLPDISGLVVVQKLRDLLGLNVPIIVLSGDTSMPTLNSLPHVGATYFFSKPVSSGQLLDRINEWVGAGAGMTNVEVRMPSE